MSEEIKIGTYIRTKEGYIFQIVGQSKRVDHTLYDTDNFGICSSTVLEEITKKQSKNILDLIEEGDYVNDYEVITTYGYDKDGNDKDELGIAVITDCDEVDYIPISEIKIKTVVTIEQIERIKYRVEE